MVKNVILLVIVVVGLFLLFKWGFSNGNKEEKPLEEIPEKYLTYQPISDSFKNERYQLKSFKLGTYKLTQIVHLNTADSTLILMGSNYGAPAQSLPRPIIHNYYKLNSQGKVLDSLQLSADEIALTRDGYLVGKDYHCSWMLDGDTFKKPYQFLNDSINWDSEKDLASFEKLYKTASRVIYQDYHIERKLYASIKLLNDGVWTKLQKPEYFERIFRFETYPAKPIIIRDPLPTNKPSEVDGFSHSHLPNLAEDENMYTNENEHISLVHFRKVKFVEGKNNGAFNPNSMTYAAKWNGDGFMQLSFKGETIPFRIVLNKMQREEDGYERKFGHPIRFFTNKSLNFGIVSENYGDLFLIKLTR